MPLPSLPDSPLLSKSLWQNLSIRDALYAVLLSYMLINQHFSNEERLQKLEQANVQIAATMDRMSVKMDHELMPRQEYDQGMSSLSLRLGNIETGQSNMMTYLLNAKK